jgi:hypothetical protein
VYFNCPCPWPAEDGTADGMAALTGRDEPAAD